jgi:glycosyltransferase involved in cell wall biosynthesis
MARICLLTPGHLSTNPRLVKEADALVGAGHDVTIIAADYALWAHEADKIFASRSWRIGRTLRFGPNAGLQARIFQLLRQRGARVMMALGVRNLAVVQAAWHPIAPDLLSAAKNIKADLYVAHYPAALPAAAIAARTHGAPFAYDAEDFHLGDYPEGPAYEPERRMIRAIEAHYLPQCTYVTAASPGIAEAYAQSYGIARPTVVLNVFPRANAPAAATPKGSASPGPSIYWFSQTIGPDRGLECAVRAIGSARSQPHLYLRGTPVVGYLNRLQDLAEQAGVLDRLHLLPPAAPSEMERLAANYDLGLVGETGHTLNRRIALTNKQFTYLLAGIPAVMSDTSAHRSFANEAGLAARLYSVNDWENLSVVLDSLLCDPDAISMARAAAWRLGRERFNWDLEKASLLDRIASICGASNRAVSKERAV